LDHPCLLFKQGQVWIKISLSTETHCLTKISEQQTSATQEFEKPSARSSKLHNPDPLLVDALLGVELPENNDNVQDHAMQHVENNNNEEEQEAYYEQMPRIKDFDLELTN
jgi:hypothetical protein